MHATRLLDAGLYTGELGFLLNRPRSKTLRADKDQKVLMFELTVQALAELEEEFPSTVQGLRDAATNCLKVKTLELEAEVEVIDTCTSYRDPKNIKLRKKEQQN